VLAACSVLETLDACGASETGWGFSGVTGAGGCVEVCDEGGVIVDAGLAGAPLSIRAANPGATAPIIKTATTAKRNINIPRWFFINAISIIPCLHYFFKLRQIREVF
jgi:hypothetical protein